MMCDYPKFIWGTWHNMCMQCVLYVPGPFPSSPQKKKAGYEASHIHRMDIMDIQSSLDRDKVTPVHLHVYVQLWLNCIVFCIFSQSLNNRKSTPCSFTASLIRDYWATHWIYFYQMLELMILGMNNCWTYSTVEFVCYDESFVILNNALYMFLYICKYNPFHVAQLLRLLLPLAGDVETNPGPGKSCFYFSCTNEKYLHMQEGLKRRLNPR